METNKKLVIYKYPVTALPLLNIFLPKDARILSLQLQNDTPTMWVLFDDNFPKIKRVFAILPTGRIPECFHEDYKLKKFIDTFQLPSGTVLHLFEIEEPQGDLDGSQ